MPLIEKVLEEFDESLEIIPLKVDRHLLQKRRWRKSAEDGEDFAFALDAPLKQGDIFWQGDQVLYRITQEHESVLEVEIPRDRTEAVKLGWLLGNMHQPIEVREGKVYMVNELTIRQKLQGAEIRYLEKKDIFCPPAHSGHHHH
ncbi:MAG: hypothetical protein AAGA18_03555 [Verrucomicrobiota bacterium]